MVLRYLRRLDEMPDHTDQLFVVDRNEYLRGVLPVNRLLVSDPDARLRLLMCKANGQLHPNEKAHEAAQAFERTTCSAPVVDS